MTTASGQETQAVYGFVVDGDASSSTTSRPTGSAVAFDRPEPTFRDEIAADYKAGRAADPRAARASRSG